MDSPRRGIGLGGDISLDDIVACTRPPLVVLGSNRLPEAISSRTDDDRAGRRSSFETVDVWREQRKPERRKIAW